MNYYQFIYFCKYRKLTQKKVYICEKEKVAQPCESARCSAPVNKK